ncbi:LptA/OstA family protein [Synechococcus sp. PCC 6312]|uniref:LptA/OstA family protein n=1 Tax=Synechococcus sp. (strain ATCC 27167 / PCC 6312) TaxID=195253 RepID=UPI00029F3834|nr:LptA/OstA family protein [Synechococcus sp. PCC 6312]AFY62648.1 hypothetical protein Syn6312_3632 [Synechococcus sp. PCC 6312]
MTRFNWGSKRLLLGLLLGLGVLGTSGIAESQNLPTSDANAVPQQALTILADVQQANSITGIVTARGNVQLIYPARQIQATATQAQYFSRERRIVLTGNVYVLQKGNSLRGDSVTYLIDQEKFVATPVTNQQVESILLIRDNPPKTTNPNP